MIFTIPGMERYLSVWDKVPLADLDAVLEYASKSQKPAVTALLLDYKNRMYGQRHRALSERIRTEKELGIRPRTIAECRKLFRLGETERGWVVLGYKGSAQVVEVPAEIGKKPVIAVKRWILKTECQTPYSVILPQGIREIGFQAFSQCKHLTDITIPDSVTEIGRSAFEGCSSLTSVTIPGSVQCVGACMFEDCTQLSHVTIQPGVKKIEHYPFQGCNGLNVSIPASVTDISRYAFEYSYWLTITTPAGSCAERAAWRASAHVITV